MEIKNLLIEQSKITQSYILGKANSFYKNGRLNTSDVRLVNESLIAIDKLLSCDFISPHDRILLEQTFRIGNDIAHQKLTYFNSYYYAYSNISKGGLDEKQRALILINTETSTMLTTILGFNRGISRIGGSTDDYFVARMERVFWAIDFVLKKQLLDIYIPVLYVIVNLIQSLNEYILSKDTQYDKQATALLKTAYEKLIQFENINEVKEILSHNSQLFLFYASQKNKAIETLKLDEKALSSDLKILPEIKTEQKLRILSSLYHLNIEDFINFFESNLSEIIKDITPKVFGLNNALFLHCLSLYCIATAKIDSIDLDLTDINRQKIDLSKNLGSIFNEYDNSHKEIIEKNELDLLISYNDDTLREKVANTIIGVDKNVLTRESKKPHGAFEIADMEIRISMKNEHYFLCMPFKSGREIASATVPETISYQIFRPFIHFNNCIVIFITAKRCSQNLMNYIKRMQDKLGWPIAVIENEELAKLLKINGQLN